VKSGERHERLMTLICAPNQEIGPKSETSFASTSLSDRFASQTARRPPRDMRCECWRGTWLDLTWLRELVGSRSHSKRGPIHARFRVVVLCVRIPRAAVAAVGSASATARIGLGEQFVARSRKSAPSTWAVATQRPADDERASAQREQTGTGGCNRTEGRRLEEDCRSRAHRDARRHRRLSVRWAQGFAHRLWQLPVQGPAEAGGAQPQNWGEDDRRGGETGAEASNAPATCTDAAWRGSLYSLSLPHVCRDRVRCIRPPSRHLRSAKASKMPWKPATQWATEGHGTRALIRGASSNGLALALMDWHSR